MLPMPTPAPSAPSPTPRARPIALPAFVTSPVVAARSVCTTPSLVLGLDGRADVDGGQCGEDERLDPDDDHDLEDVEDRRGNDHGQKLQRLEDEDQPEEREDQDVPGEHVREESDAQRDQPHELPENLERHDQDQQSLRSLGDPTLEVARRAVPANPLEVREHERDERERERDRERARRGVDAPGRDAVVRLARDRQRDEAEQIDHEDEQQQRRDVREPARDRLRRQTLLRHLHLSDLVDRLADRLARAGTLVEPEPHQEDPEQDCHQRAQHQVDDRFGDREVERAEMDRHPLLLLELLRRIEVAARECRGRKREGEQDDGEQAVPHRVSPLKYVVSERPSSNVYASAYVTTAATATCGCDAAVATRTASNTMALKKTPNACTAEPATLAVGLRRRAST